MAKKAKAKKARHAPRRASRKAVPRKAVKARTRKARGKKAAVKKGIARTTIAKVAAVRHPDKRVPVGDGEHELLYKWDAAANEYRHKEVPIGGDWQLKARPKKAVAKKGRARAAMAEGAVAGHPDKRVPVGDGVHELLYKWDAAANQYRSKEVPIGGDWQLGT
jgi:hypothetical protein